MESESSLKLIESYFSQAKLQRIFSSRPPLLANNKKLSQRSISIDFNSQKFVPKKSKVNSFNNSNNSFESIARPSAINQDSIKSRSPARRRIDNSIRQLKLPPEDVRNEIQSMRMRSQERLEKVEDKITESQSSVYETPGD